jgi:hypothetical protein
MGYEVTVVYRVEEENTTEETKSEVANALVDGGILNTDTNTNIIDIQPLSAEVKEVKVTIKDYLKKETAEVI